MTIRDHKKAPFIIKTKAGFTRRNIALGENPSIVFTHNIPPKEFSHVRNKQLNTIHFAKDHLSNIYLNLLPCDNFLLRNDDFFLTTSLPIPLLLFIVIFSGLTGFTLRMENGERDEDFEAGIGCCGGVVLLSSPSAYADDKDLDRDETKKQNFLVFFKTIEMAKSANLRNH